MTLTVTLYFDEWEQLKIKGDNSPEAKYFEGWIDGHFARTPEDGSITIELNRDELRRIVTYLERLEDDPN